ncbi:MAG: DNA-binding protein [Panacagrimonas sp.]
MARAGIFKWDVKDARDQLVKEGKHPSVDAIRALLGNTGSKSTIHRYLKELESEGGASTATISEALQALVSQLTDRLKHEAEEELLAATQRFDADRASIRVQLTQAQDEAQRVRNQLERAEVALAGERGAHLGVGVELQAERTRTVRLTEQVQGLEQRLAEQASYRQSLEEKHENARQALEHFRTAAKEQREQEQRRHEQQVQQLQAELRAVNATLSEKLSQLTQVNRDAAVLSAESSSLRSQAQEARIEKQQLEKQILQLHDQASQGEGRRVSLEGQLQDAKATQTEQQQRIVGDAQRIRELELAAARTEGQLEQTQGRVQSLQVEMAQLMKLARAYGVVGTTEALRDASLSDMKRLEKLRAEAVRVLESTDGAELWIHQRSFALGNVAPITLIRSDEDLATAINELGRIEHGIPV